MINIVSINNFSVPTKTIDFSILLVYELSVSEQIKNEKLMIFILRNNLPYFNMAVFTDLSSFKELALKGQNLFLAQTD